MAKVCIVTMEFPDNDQSPVPLASLTLAQCLSSLGHQVNVATWADKEIVNSADRFLIHKIFSNEPIQTAIRWAKFYAAHQPEIIHIVWQSTRGPRQWAFVGFLMGLVIPSAVASGAKVISSDLQYSRNIINRLAFPLLKSSFKTDLVFSLPISNDVKSAEISNKTLSWFCSPEFSKTSEQSFLSLLKFIKDAPQWKLQLIAQVESLSPIQRLRLEELISSQNLRSKVSWTWVRGFKNWAMAANGVAVFFNEFPINPLLNQIYRRYLKQGQILIFNHECSTAIDGLLVSGQNCFLLNKDEAKLGQVITALKSETMIAELQGAAQKINSLNGDDLKINELNRFYTEVLGARPKSLLGL
ncbi:MAG: hypothetical protein IT289_00150 [Oligoflexia bacterium]|nr:hypothetical protein [Oligoflexia bacterium]